MNKYATLDIEKLLNGVNSALTIASYKVGWRKYLEFCGKRDPMDATVYVAWRQHMITVDGYSRNAINNRLHSVRAVARELYARREIDRNTYYDMLEVKILSPHALKERARPHNRVRISPEDMRRLCTAPEVSVENPVALRDRALMFTLATTGLRISEALAMQYGDIRAAGNSYIVTNVLGKMNGNPRTVPLSAEAYSTIMDWIEFRPVQSNYIFTAVIGHGELGMEYSDKPIKPQSALSRIKMYADQIGLPHIKAHDFRRFVGTQLAAKDLRQAQKILGHRQISTTLTHYVMDDIQVGITSDLF